MAESQSDDTQAALVGRSLSDLGWRGSARVVSRLAAGGSGSQVFLLDLEGERAVLKVTENLAWYDRAVHELAVYRDFGAALHEFLPVARATYRSPRAIRLLLVAHDPYPPAFALTATAWVGVADRLGQLHHVAVPATPWLTGHPWPSPAEVVDGIRGWTVYGIGDLASRAAEQLEVARNALSVPGPVLTHGDCHVGNLLHGPDGRALWVDWQEVRLGSGLGDLVFLWQRAEFNGAHPPRAAMTSAYAGARSLPETRDLAAALAACELRLLLVDWPPFLAYGSTASRELMTRRLQRLVDGGEGQ